MTSHDDGRAARDGRLAGWAGLVFSILSLIVIPLVAAPAMDPPVLGTRGPAVIAWYQAHRTGFLVGNYLGVLAFAPGLVQLAALAERVRRLEGPGGFLGALVLATGAFTYAIFAGSLVVFQVLPFVLESSSAETLGWLAAVWFSFDGLAAVPLVLAVAWAARRTGALPAGLVTASYPVAALALAMSFGTLTDTPAWLAAGGPLTFAGFVGFFAWTGAIAVATLRQGGAAAAR